MLHQSVRPKTASICYPSCQITLKRHEQSHNWKRVFDCPKCDRKFGNSSNRDKHVRGMHEKLKPYKCTICDKKFSDPSELKKHIQSHTKEHLFKCMAENCAKTFKYSNEVRAHMWRDHNIHITETITSHRSNEITEVCKVTKNN